MSTFEPDQNNAKYQIRSYAKGRLMVNDVLITHSVIITPTALLTWDIHTIAALSPQTLALILPLKPTILLIGTGETLLFPPLESYGHLINHGIGVEIMATGAASRTYGILSAENRHVIAALIL